MPGCRVLSPFFSDNEIVVAGGLMPDGVTPSNQIDSFDVASGTWTTQRSTKLSQARCVRAPILHDRVCFAAFAAF